MKEFLNELARLWWVEVGTNLTDPLSEDSIAGLRKILKEEYDFDSEVIEYIVESAVKTPTNFHLGGNRESGMQVGTNDTAVSAHLHSDEDDDLDGAIDYDEPLEEEDTDEKDSEDKERPDSGDDKEEVKKDIEQSALTAKEKDKLKEIDDKLLKTKLTNPTTGNKNQVSTLLGKKKSDPAAYKVGKTFLGDKGVSDDEIENQSDKSDDDTTITSGVDRKNFDKKEKEHKDNPNGPTRKEILDNLNDGNLDVLSEYQNGVSQNREKGIAGAGGPVASEGESKYCAAVDTDFDKWESENKDAVNETISKFKEKKKSADENRTADHLGLDSDSDEFNTYLAKREVWSNQQLDKLKADKDSVFYKNFKGDDGAYKDWMKVAYDGGRTTQQAVKESPIDTAKPHKTIQSTSEVDQAVEAHLEDVVKNAKSPEDKKHAETQLKNFEKFKSYHDTYVIGKDEMGRTTYMGISNKKDDQLRDPQNNTTPKTRFESLEKSYGKDVAEGVSNSLNKNIDRVSNVQQNTVKTASNMEVTDDFVAVCETPEMKKYMTGLRGRKDMKKYLADNGIDITKVSNKELLVEMNNKAKELIDSGKKVPYNPYGKIAIKVGEFSKVDKFKKQYPDINFDDSSVAGSIDIKQKEQSVVTDSHKSLVSDLVNADKPDGYSEDNPDADNGKHQQGYISGVLDACHIDTYIDMGSDDGMLLQMGINGVKPSMIRNCVAERSGFKGDTSTTEGKKALKGHLRKRCRVTPGESSVKIMDNGKEVDLFEDTWRTAGTSQKVATHFGGAMRKCLQSKAAR